MNKLELVQFWESIVTIVTMLFGIASSTYCFVYPRFNKIRFSKNIRQLIPVLYEKYQLKIDLITSHNCQGILEHAVEDGRIEEFLQLDIDDIQKWIKIYSKNISRVINKSTRRIFLVKLKL